MEGIGSSDMGTASESELPKGSAPIRAEKRTAAERLATEWAEQDRQWDIRINLGDGDCTLAEASTELDWFVDKVRAWDKIKYVFVGGIEVGDNPSQDDFKRFHVHVCLILFTPNTRRAVVHNLGLAIYSTRKQRS